MVYVIMLIGIEYIEFILSISPKLTAMPETLEYTLPFQVTVVAYTKELERLWWYCYWRIYWPGHILFRVCVRRINEHGTFVGPFFAVRGNGGKPVALLIGHLCWNTNNRNGI